MTIRRIRIRIKSLQLYLNSKLELGRPSDLTGMALIFNHNQIQRSSKHKQQVASSKSIGIAAAAVASVGTLTASVAATAACVDAEIPIIAKSGCWVPRLVTSSVWEPAQQSGQGPR